MKKLLTLGSLIFFALFAPAQNTYQVTVEGHLILPDGSGVPNTEVRLTTDSLPIGNWSYSNTLFTNSNGVFLDTFDVPATASIGFLLAEVDDCNNNFIYGFGYFDIISTEILMDIAYCDTIGNPHADSCGVFIDCDPAGNLVATAFGTPPFTFAWNTGEVTEVITPQDTGTYCVTVTDATGCISEGCSHYVGTGGGFDSCFVFIFEDLSAAGLPTLIAQNFGVAPYTFVWSTGDSSQWINPNGDGVYCVTSTDATGCVSTACIDFISNPWGDTCGVHVYCDPNGVFVAEGYGSAPFTYLWSTGDSTATFMPLDSGEYCVTLTDATGCVAVGCYYFDGGVLPSDSCFTYINMGFEQDLFAFSIGVGPFTYLWNTGDTIPIIFPQDTGTYCVTVTDATGCISEACATWNPTPPDSCYVQVFETGLGLNAEVAGDPSNYIFFWDTGDSTQTIQPQGTGTYCVTAINVLSGCASTSCYFYDDGSGDTTCHVVVLELPDSLGARTLFALGSGVEPFSYLWDTGENTPFIHPTDLGEHCVTITDATGCVAVGCSGSDPNANGSSSISGNIYTIDSTQFPVFVTGIVELIESATGNIVDTTSVINLNGFPFYDFGNVPDGNYLVRATVSNPDGSNFIPTYHFTTTLSTEANEITTPYSTSVFWGNSFDILVFDVQNRPGKGSIAGNVSKEQRFSGTVDQGKVDLEGIMILLFDETHHPLEFVRTDAAGNFSFPELAYGTYHIYIDIPGHENTYITETIHEDKPDVQGLNFHLDNGRISGTNGISSSNDYEVSKVFQVFPNPATDVVNVAISGILHGDAYLELMNANGVSLQSKAIENSKNVQQTKLDVSNLAKGFYLLRLTTENGIQVEKLMIN